MKGSTIIQALDEQVIHYTIKSSLFDIVSMAIIRFVFLNLFYGVFGFNHWIIIAVRKCRNNSLELEVTNTNLFIFSSQQPGPVHFS